MMRRRSPGDIICSLGGVALGGRNLLGGLGRSICCWRRSRLEMGIILANGSLTFKIIYDI